VLGIQYLLLGQDTTLATLLLGFALTVWIVLVYAFFVGMIVTTDKPTLEKGLNGTWLLIIVSIQSLAVLGTLLASQLPYPTSVILFGTLCMFLLGFLFYLIFITLILYRLLFLPEKAEDFTPPYWIDMGAVAITTLAGATLIEAIQTTVGTGLADLLPFIKGISLLAWATGTWWIPLIVLLEGWRHGYKKVPLVYSPQYWSLVFPLGMYMVSTWRLGEALRMPFLQTIAHAFIYVALLAWIITFVAMSVSFVKSITSERTKN
jgi:tellurite resistance protein TehA-like permease